MACHHMSGTWSTLSRVVESVITTWTTPRWLVATYMTLAAFDFPYGWIILIASPRISFRLLVSAVTYLVPRYSFFSAQTGLEIRKQNPRLPENWSLAVRVKYSGSKYSAMGRKASEVLLSRTCVLEVDLEKWIERASVRAERAQKSTLFLSCRLLRGGKA